MRVRRVVTGHDKAGRSRIAQDAGAPQTHEDRDAGLVFHELWRTEGPLASNDGSAEPVPRELDVLPPWGGTALRIMEVAPFDGVERLQPHVSDTTDYNIVLQGEITAITDEGETVLRAGDVVVVCGARHSWRNDGSEPCVFASIMVRDPASPVLGREGAR